MVSVLFLYFKTTAQYCSTMLSGALCSAEVTHRYFTATRSYLLKTLLAYIDNSFCLDKLINQVVIHYKFLFFIKDLKGIKKRNYWQ